MKKIFTILVVFSIIAFVSCSAPSGSGAASASTSGSGDVAGDVGGDVAGGGSTGNDENAESGKPVLGPITISVDGTVATGMPLERVLGFEWKPQETSVVPSVVFSEDRAIYIKINATDVTHTSWGTWLYNESTKVFDTRTAATVFFQADDKGMWTGKLIMNSGEVLSPFPIINSDSWTFK